MEEGANQSKPKNQILKVLKPSCSYSVCVFRWSLELSVTPQTKQSSFFDWCKLKIWDSNSDFFQKSFPQILHWCFNFFISSSVHLCFFFKCLSISFLLAYPFWHCGHKKGLHLQISLDELSFSSSIVSELFVSLLEVGRSYKKSVHIDSLFCWNKIYYFLQYFRAKMSVENKIGSLIWFFHITCWFDFSTSPAQNPLTSKK